MIAFLASGCGTVRVALPWRGGAWHGAGLVIHHQWIRATGLAQGALSGPQRAAGTPSGVGSPTWGLAGDLNYVMFGWVLFALR